MRQILGICGSGLIGTDPWHPHSWSGSSPYFFGACRDAGLLYDAIGLDAPIPWKGIFALRSYLRNSSHWKRLFYMDPGFRNVMTGEMRKALRGRELDCDILQLGALYDATAVTGTDVACYSYNDGNFIMGARSPYFPPSIPASRVDATIAYEREVNGRLDRVFTMSEFLRRSFIDDYGVPEERVVNIGAGINMPELPPPPSSKNYDSGEILFIGIDFYRKGGQHLLEAFRRVRERVGHARLHIVGPRTLPKGASDIDGVLWHGFLRKESAEDLARLDGLFQRASVFVMPSLYEPFGIAPLEAMAHEIPCVVTDDWALPEIVPKGVCGENVPAGDADRLADVLVELLKDPSRLQRFGAAGRRRVEEEFTWPGVVRRMVGALKSPGAPVN